MKILNTEIEVVRGSLQEQLVDGIVNIADTDMRGGDGLDGAIHRAAGIDLIKELEKVAPYGAKAGQVVVTGAHKLPQKRILHLARPDWDPSKASEYEQTLRQCYFNCLEEAEKRGLETLALPSLSTGIRNFPMEKAVSMALEAVVQYLNVNLSTRLQRVIFVTFGGAEFYYFQKAVQKWEGAD